MSRRLLLLEDDDTLRTHLSRRLEQHQFVVYPCATVEQALATLQTSVMSFAVLDQNVEDRSGLDLIDPLMAQHSHCRIVILTGYGSIPAAVAATRRGARNYLTKPASLKDILHALDDAADTNTLPSLPDAPPSLERLEWEHIQRVMDEHDGNVSAAARTLGIHRRTLQRRLKKRPSASDYDRDRQGS